MSRQKPPNGFGGPVFDTYVLVSADSVDRTPSVSESADHQDQEQQEQRANNPAGVRVPPISQKVSGVAPPRLMPKFHSLPQRLTAEKLPASPPPTSAIDARSPERFKPFNSTALVAGRWLEDYSRWHTVERQRRDVPCNAKEAIVFVPSLAGLGDRIRSLNMAFFFAIARGMLFFIAWTEPRHWSVGLSDVGFDWDWDGAVRRGDMCGADEFDAVAPRTKAVLVHGGIYQAIERRAPPPLAGFKGDLSGYVGSPLIRPSPAVRRVLESRFIGALRGAPCAVHGWPWARWPTVSHHLLPRRAAGAFRSLGADEGEGCSYHH